MLIKNRTIFLLLGIIAVGLIFAAPALANSAWPNLSAEDSKNIMPVSELKRGMRGYGLTVFHGTQIEKFDFEILGVLKKMNTGRDLILIRAGGGPITSRETGIVAGMSGSPCYINGKLIGAVSYGSQFSKEPVGMVTPIADMLEAWDENLPKQASGYSSPQTLSQSLKVDGKTVTQIGIDESGTQTSAIDDGVLYMRPLMMPMMVSGLSERGIEKLSELLRPFHIQPVAGPGGGSKEGSSDPEVKFVPGAAIGVSLVSGDIDMTGVGTLTYRRGNRIVGFGHPMLGIGAIDAPMTTAYVDDMISSYRVSTKLASPIKTIGRIFQDRPWCIAGRIGEMPKMIPVTITVDDEAFKRTKIYKVNVINHPLLASRLITTVASEAIYDTHSTPGDATAEVSYDVIADQVGKISRSNIFFDPASIDAASITDFGTLMQLLSSNKFQPLDIKSVNMKVKIVDKRNTATIDRIFVKKSDYEPGETVDVGVVLRPYKKDRITRTYSLKIPATAADGKIVLVVRGGASPSTLMGGTAAALSADDATMSMVAPQDGGIANVDNVKQLIDKYLETERNNEVVVRMLMRSAAINVNGEKLSGMPNALADIMKSSRNSGLRMERDEVKMAFPEDMIVYGTAQLAIDVKHKDLNESKSQPKAAAGSTNDDSGTVQAMADDDTSAMTDFAAVAPVLNPMADTPSVDVTENTADSDDNDTAQADDNNNTAADASKPAETKTAAPAATPATTQANVKTVVRQPKTWTQKTQADFAKGTFSGVSASSENQLELAPTLQKVAETGEQFVWCVAPAKSGVYAGTGNSGKILLVADNGQVSDFYDTDELEVHALVRDAAGNIYAGTSPHGKIFKISPDGKGRLFFTTDEKYVLSLALDKQGNLYAGVGDAGKVYKITPDGKGSVFSQVNEQQVLSLFFDKQGSLLVGTGINGVVYRMREDGRAEPIFDAPEDSITAVVSDSKDNVYAGTSAKGVVYKIFPDGRSKTVFTKATRVLSMAVDKRDNVFAVSDGTLVQITPAETAISLDSGQDKVQFLSLAYNGMTDALYAGTANVGVVYVSKCCGVRGEYESAVHDTGMISKWGRIKWIADVPNGSSVQIRTRVGNVETPDSTWTDWSQPYTNASGEEISGPQARYIQYQVTLTTGSENTTPTVSTVSLSYLTPNQEPTVKLTSPQGGEVWAGKQTIKWVGSDPDKDSLTYDVLCSKDGGKNWVALQGGLTGGTTDTKKPDAAKVTEKIKSELEKSKDVPEDMKKQIIGDKDGKSDAAPAAAADSSAAAKSSSNPTYSWDTKGVADGTYIVKIVASDKASNATDARTGEVVSQPFVICNNGPKLTLYDKTVEVKGSGAAKLAGSASSAAVEIVGVQYRIDGGDWAAAVPDDGMCDSPYETFSVVTGSLSAGKHKLEVEAIDAAGNATTQTVEVNVSA